MVPEGLKTPPKYPRALDPASPMLSSLIQRPCNVEHNPQLKGNVRGGRGRVPGSVESGRHSIIVLSMEALRSVGPGRAGDGGSHATECTQSS